MKTTIISFSIFILSTLIATSQVGIGTDDPNVNSVLDISSSDKGLLMPRVALTATNSAAPLNTHVLGMTVYNTATSGVQPYKVTPGFYVNDGSRWFRAYDDATIDTKWVNNPGNSSVELLNLSDGSTARPAGTQFVILDNGNVGVGTSDATDKLTVNIGTEDGKGITLNGEDNIIRAFTFNELATGQGEINWRKTGVEKALAASIRSVGTTSRGRKGLGFFTGDFDDFTTDAVERMRITPDGRVGIGTTTPESQLQIALDYNVVGLNMQGIIMDVATGDKGSISFSGGPLTISNSSSNKPLNLFSDNGPVIINAKYTSPGGIYLKTNDAKRLEVVAKSGGGEYDGVAVYDIHGNVTAKFSQGGLVGIGTVTPTEKLEVNGAIKIDNGGYTGIVADDATPVPTGGAGTIVFSNGAFFGWNGTAWKKLDN